MARQPLPSMRVPCASVEPRADGDDPVVLDHDVAGGVLGAGGVDGRDRAAFDDELHRCAASLTASRIFS